MQVTPGGGASAVFGLVAQFLASHAFGGALSMVMQFAPDALGIWTLVFSVSGGSVSPDSLLPVVLLVVTTLVMLVVVPRVVVVVVAAVVVVIVMSAVAVVVVVVGGPSIIKLSFELIVGESRVAFYLPVYQPLSDVHSFFQSLGLG